MTYDYVLFFMIVRILCRNLALACTPYPDDDKDPLLRWRCRRIEREDLGESLAKLSAASIKRVDAGYLPSDRSFMITESVLKAPKDLSNTFEGSSRVEQPHESMNFVMNAS